MLWRRTIVMLAVFAALLAASLLVPALESGRTGPSLKLPRIDTDRIVRFEISGEEGVKLEKRDGAWFVMPKNAPADAKTVDKALETLASVETGSLRSENPEFFARYEVSDQDPIVSAFDSEGSVLSIHLGKDTPDNRGNYVRLPDDDRVFATRGRIRSSLLKKLKYWRDRSVLSFENEQAVAMRIVRGQETFSFAKGEQDQWGFSQEPRGLSADFRLDSQIVTRAVDTLSNLSASDFADEVSDLSEAGLDPPRLRVEVDLDQEGAPLAVLLLGTEEENKFYAKVPDRDQVFFIGSYQAKSVDKAPEDFRDLGVLSYSPAEARKLAIFGDGFRLVFDRPSADADWRIAESTQQAPEGFTLDPQKVGALASSLSRLKAASYAGPDASLPRYGLAGAARRVEVVLEDGSVHTLRIGRKAGEKEIYVAARSGPAFKIAEYSVDRLLQGIDHYKVAAAKKQPMMSPEMLKNLPPEVAEQLIQKQRQKIMQEQLMRRFMRQQQKQQKEGTEK